jgi:hypothetical protein
VYRRGVPLKGSKIVLPIRRWKSRSAQDDRSLSGQLMGVVEATPFRGKSFHRLSYLEVRFLGAGALRD